MENALRAAAPPRPRLTPGAASSAGAGSKGPSPRRPLPASPAGWGLGAGGGGGGGTGRCGAPLRPGGRRPGCRRVRPGPRRASLGRVVRGGSPGPWEQSARRPAGAPLPGPYPGPRPQPGAPSPTPPRGPGNPGCRGRGGRGKRGGSRSRYASFPVRGAALPYLLAAPARPARRCWPGTYRSPSTAADTCRRISRAAPRRRSLPAPLCRGPALWAAIGPREGGAEPAGGIRISDWTGWTSLFSGPGSLRTEVAAEAGCRGLGIPGAKPAAPGPGTPQRRETGLMTCHPRPQEEGRRQA